MKGHLHSFTLFGMTIDSKRSSCMLIYQPKLSPVLLVDLSWDSLLRAYKLSKKGTEKHRLLCLLHLLPVVRTSVVSKPDSGEEWRVGLPLT